MGLVTVTGNMSTGFQRFEGQATIDAYKGTQSWPGGWVDTLIEEPEVEFGDEGAVYPDDGAN